MKHVSVLVAVVVLGCGGTTETPDAGATDSGARDTGAARTDAGGAMDSGNSDPCAIDFDTDPVDLVGCNGDVPGPGSANAFGGRCTPGTMTNPAGSCTGTGAVCLGDSAPGAFCVRACTPTPGNYTTTSTCPTGSRCFFVSGDMTPATNDDVGICFPDCNEDADCASGVCDQEGSCAPVDAPDSGVTDAGAVVDAAVDAGPATTDSGTANDAGATDSGTTADSGTSVDSGTTADSGTTVDAGVGDAASNPG